jgi:hypothetical protein
VSVDACPEESDAAAPRRVALTMGQRARLLKDCLPAAFFIVALIVVPWVLEASTGTSPSKALYAFLIVVIAVCLYSAQQRARDLASGVAVVEEDLLIRTGRSRRGSHRWSQLERLGRIRCTPAAYAQGRPGVRHIVTYSPASRIAWSLEPIV